MFITLTVMGARTPEPDNNGFITRGWMGGWIHKLIIDYFIVYSAMLRRVDPAMVVRGTSRRAMHMLSLLILGLVISYASKKHRVRGLNEKMSSIKTKRKN